MEHRRTLQHTRALSGAALLLAITALPALAALRPGTRPNSRTPRRPNVPAPQRPGKLSFNRDIRPIISENCLLCHGPDKNKRVSGFRLDVREEAVARGVVVPGKPEKSKLIQRIFAADDARRMPPPSTHKRLTPAEKSTLRRWIAEGAVYEPHWAFVPLPARAPVPPVKDPAWCRNEIDRFVLARLEQEGLRPAPGASRSEWLRRVTFDLTGLPPTLPEADAFLKDTSAAAYEKVVDRLLASPRYGERMAQPWLDVARYADSYGYQSDQLCPTWPYRDWVVNAFNRNLPYDRFITRQLAGDLLPDATRETRLATAFNRLHRMTNEGGSVAEEWRMEGVADRVKTFGMAFLGLTFECARCHDHKYDPITQRDFYGLSAFFNSIDEYGLYDRADIVPAPSLLLPTPEQEKEYAAARDAVKQAEAALAGTRAEREGAFREWLSKPRSEPALPAADLSGHFDFEAFQGAALANLAPGAKENGQRADEAPLVEGRSGKAVRLDGENNVNFPGLGRFTRQTPFTIAFWMYDPAGPDGRRAEPAVVFQACDGTDTGPHGYDLLLEGGCLTARIFRHWPGNAIGVRSGRQVPKNTWTHVAVTYDGSSRAAGLKIYVDGDAGGLETVRDHLYKGTGRHTLVFGQRFRDRGFKGGRIDELFIYNRAVTPLEAAQLSRAGQTLPAPSEGLLRDYYFSAVDPQTRKAAAALTAARQRLVSAEDAQFEVAVMDEMPQPRPTYVLARGRYDAPKTEENRVERHTPAALPPFPSSFPKNRLGLAQWLLLPDHPLTGRVAVNRFWALFFGRGLVETLEDFGTQGKLPTHPELLDWLARRFVSGVGGPGVGIAPAAPRTLNPQPWSVKALCKLIVLSSTYRQASAVRPELKERDPDNALLARGPAFRLSAEAIRDLALAAGGLLDGRMGGPPVSPYQPGDLWREANSMSPAYHQSVGADLYRRSLYTVWKRTVPMPNMTAFDAVSREVCVARRQPTNTPLQALVLLNDPQFVEAARVLGERIVREGGPTAAERVRFAFRTLATREPGPAEARLLQALYEEQRAEFTHAPERAVKLLRIGERKPDPALPPADVAAATILAQTILNLDATIWNR